MANKIKKNFFLWFLNFIVVLPQTIILIYGFWNKYFSSYILLLTCANFLENILVNVCKKKNILVLNKHKISKVRKTFKCEYLNAKYLK